MVEHIHEIIGAVIHLYSKNETNGMLPTALLYDIAKFTESVHKFIADDAH